MCIPVRAAADVHFQYGCPIRRMHIPMLSCVHFPYGRPHSTCATRVRDRYTLIADVVSTPASRVVVDAEVMQRVLTHLATRADEDGGGDVGMHNRMGGGDRQATLVRVLQVRPPVAICVPVCPRMAICIRVRDRMHIRLRARVAICIPVTAPPCDLCISECSGAR